MYLPGQPRRERLGFVLGITYMTQREEGCLFRGPCLSRQWDRWVLSAVCSDAVGHTFSLSLSRRTHPSISWRKHTLSVSENTQSFSENRLPEREVVSESGFHKAGYGTDLRGPATPTASGAIARSNWQADRDSGATYRQIEVASRPRPGATAKPGWRATRDSWLVSWTLEAAAITSPSYDGQIKAPGAPRLAVATTHCS